MRIVKSALIATALLAATAAPAAAQQDVCITYDFAGSELCVIEEATQAAGTAETLAWQLIRDHDVCPVIDFTGRRFCLVGDTIGYGG